MKAKSQSQSHESLKKMTRVILKFIFCNIVYNSSFFHASLLYVYFSYVAAKPAKPGRVLCTEQVRRTSAQATATSATAAGCPDLAKVKYFNVRIFFNQCNISVYFYNLYIWQFL